MTDSMGYLAVCMVGAALSVMLTIGWDLKALLKKEKILPMSKPYRCAWCERQALLHGVYPSGSHRLPCTSNLTCSYWQGDRYNTRRIERQMSRLRVFLKAKDEDVYPLFYYLTAKFPLSALDVTLHNAQLFELSGESLTLLQCMELIEEHGKDIVESLEMTDYRNLRP